MEMSLRGVGVGEGRAGSANRCRPGAASGVDQQEQGGPPSQSVVGIHLYRFQSPSTGMAFWRSKAGRDSGMRKTMGWQPGGTRQVPVF